MSDLRYDPARIEPKWQEIWEREGTWEVANAAADGLTPSREIDQREKC